MEGKRTLDGERGLSPGVVNVVLVVLGVVIASALVWVVFAGSGTPSAEEVPDSGFTWSPEAPNTGEAVTFDASAATPPEDGTDYAWDFDGDGETDASGPVANYTFDEPGDRAVSLTVTDARGPSNVSTRTVTINRGPTVEAGEDTTIVVGSSFSRSIDIADSDSTGWRVVVDYGDGTNDTETTTVPSVALSHDYATAGEYPVTVTVTDEEGASGTDSFVVSIENTPPTVTLSGVIDAEGSPTTIRAAFTDSGIGETHTAVVDWGDGEETNATVTPGRSGGVVVANHSYEDDGVYTITVTVTDNGGERDSGTLTVRVANVAPTIDLLSVERPVIEGRSTHLDGNFTDLGSNDSHTAVVDWGDGNVSEVEVWQTRNTVDTDHVYAEDGIYTATLLITDDEGASDQRSVRVIVRNDRPDVTASGDTVFENATATISVSYEDFGLEDTHTAVVDWGDDTVDGVEIPGSNAGGFTASHHYLDAGSYRVRVTVTDDEGETGSDATTVLVNNRPPAIRRLTVDRKTVPEGSPVTISGFFVDASPEDSHSAEVDWGDGTVDAITLTRNDEGGSFQARHTYTAPGDYTVTIRVVDDDGGTDVERTAVTVTAAAPPVTPSPPEPTPTEPPTAPTDPVAPPVDGGGGDDDDDDRPGRGRGRGKGRERGRNSIEGL
jgi:PKD repeat protein